ncbi:MAG: CotH kinase family protein, partial [Bacteroidota bacterium]
KFLVFRNGGSDWGKAHCRDAVLTGLLQDPSWDLDHQANRPALLYINGKYWGLYHIREKINKRFVQDHRGYDKDELDLLEHQMTVKAGSSKAYQEFLSWVRDHRFDNDRHYAVLQGQMDVDNFMRLQIAQLYFDNRDAGGNIRFFRPHQLDEWGEQKWRWILYDVDYSFGLNDSESYKFPTLALHTEANGPKWPNPPWTTLLQRRLLDNSNYRKDFVNRCLDYLQTDFSPPRVIAAIHSHAARLRPEMPRALARWNLPLQHWERHIDRMKTFAQHRPAYVREEVRSYFKGGPDREVLLSQTPGGELILNDNIHLNTLQWEGHYFANFPIKIRAKPLPGFRFDRWEGLAEQEQLLPQLSVNLQRDTRYQFRALFLPYDHPKAGQIVINEIHHGPTGGWIELHNTSKQAFNLRDWFLADLAGKEVRLLNMDILPGEFLVLTSDPALVSPATLAAPVVLTSLDRLLTQNTLGLYNQRGAKMHRVTYRKEVSIGKFYALDRQANDQSSADWSITERSSPGLVNPNPAVRIGLLQSEVQWRLVAGLLICFFFWRWVRKR